MINTKSHETCLCTVGQNDSKMDCKSHQSCSLEARIISGSFDLWAHLGTHYEHIITLLHVYQLCT